MNTVSVAPFDPHLLDRPPASLWPARLSAAALTVIIAVSLAMLTAMYPIAGIGATVGLSGLLLVVRVPEIILILFGIALGVPYQLSAGGLPVNVADAMLVIWWLCIPFIILQRGAHRWRMPLLVQIVLPFVLAVLMSIVLASDPPGQLKQFMRTVQWFVALPLALCIFRPTDRLFRLLAVLLMLMPCIFAIDGMVEYFNHGNSISKMIGIPVPAPKDTSSETIHHTFDVSGRAGSTFGGAQGLATFIDLLIGVAVAHLVRPPSHGFRLLAIACLIVCAGGLAVAQSRGGLLGAATVIMVIAALQRPPFGKMLAFTGILAAAIGVFTIALWPGWDGTIASLIPGGRADAVIDRLTIWQTALDVWRDHPIFGVGLGNFRDHAMERQIDLLVPLGYESFHAHNTYIELLVDTGLVGLASYLGFLVITLGILLRRWQILRIDPNSQAATFAMAAIATLGAYVVFASVDMLFLENTHMLLVLVLSSALLTLPPIRFRESRGAVLGEPNGVDGEPEASAERAP